MVFLFFVLPKSFPSFWFFWVRLVSVPSKAGGPKKAAPHFSASVSLWRPRGNCMRLRLEDLQSSMMETIRSEFRGCLKEAQEERLAPQVEPATLSSLATGITSQIHTLREADASVRLSVFLAPHAFCFCSVSCSGFLR